MVGEAVSRQVESGVENIIFMVLAENRPMFKFVDSHLNDYLVSRVDSIYSYKTLI